MKEIKWEELSDFGEFVCPYCGAFFHEKTKFYGHIGGKHKKNITEVEKPKCNTCGCDLIAEGENQNWPNHLQKIGALRCKKCKNEKNRKSYHKVKNQFNKKRRIKYNEFRERLKRIKESTKKGI